MGAKQPEDLVAWQLAHELKIEVYALTAPATVRRDFKYCDQIRAAASSAENNIAEGFWRYHHGDFARFLVIARGSLGEVRNLLADGVDRGHLDPSACSRLRHLAHRAIIATSRLEYHVRTSHTPHFPRRHE